MSKLKRLLKRSQGVREVEGAHTEKCAHVRSTCTQNIMIRVSYAAVPYKITVNIGLCIYTHSIVPVAVWKSDVRS
jgi:hypothetical protein